MKAGTLIGWIMVAGVIVLAIAAALVLERTITSPAPPSLYESKAASGWKDSFNAKTSEIVASRQNDLATFGGPSEQLTRAASASKTLSGIVRSRQLGAQSAIESSLESAVLPGPIQVSEGYKVGLPYVNDALDEADSLYGLRVSQGTDVAVDLYTDAMEQEAPFYLRHLGFQALYGAVTRGVISYREQSSLPLYDWKSTLYQTESDTNLVNLRSIRQDTENLLSNRLGELDDRYDLLLGMLTDRIVQSMAENGTRIIDEEQIASIESLIRQHLAELNVNPSVGRLQSEVTQIPEIGSTEWIAIENEISNEFQQMSK
jgi:hypothetical protein